MPRITIINQPIYNRGDQAAFKALVMLLKKQPDIDVTVLFCHSAKAASDFVDGLEGPEYVTFPLVEKDQKFFKKVMCRPGLLRKTLRLLPEIRRYNRYIVESDFVLCAPGGICLGRYKDWRHLWNLVNAFDLKKRVGIYGRSIGPFYSSSKSDKVFTRNAINVLKKVDYLSLRDRHSQKIADNLGVAFIPAIDTAFARKPNCDMPKALALLTDRRYAVFVPNQLYKWHPSFMKIHKEEILDDLYRSIIADVLSRDLDLIMLPQLFGREDVDMPYFQELAREFDAERVVVIADSYNSDIQQNIISCSSILIGARCHSIIFAINNQVPFLCLSYEHKMDGMLEILNLSRYLLPLRELLDGNDGIRRVRSLLGFVVDNRSSILPEIENAGSKAREIANSVFDRFLLTLQGTAWDGRSPHLP